MKATVSSYICIYCLPSLIVTDKPTIRVLQNRGIIKAMAPTWYELGIALLNDDQVVKLEAIKTDHREANRCCIAMLSCWLSTNPSATWYDLIVALTSQGVELNDVAEMVKALFHG